MTYLQKIIDYVSNALKEDVPAKPAKVWCLDVQLVLDHHQQTTALLSPCAIKTCAARDTILFADGSWFGARGHKPILADVSPGSGHAGSLIGKPVHFCAALPLQCFNDVLPLSQHRACWMCNSQ